MTDEGCSLFLSFLALHVSLFFTIGMSLDVEDNKGRKPLHIASKYNSLAAIEIILQKCNDYHKYIEIKKTML